MRTALLLLLLAGCKEPRDLAWEAQFDDTALRDRVRVLEADIREGGCTGSAIWSLAFDVDAPPATMGPPDLSPGTYGFAIVARDSACERYASGCTEVVLPQEPGATVIVVLSAFPGGAACPASACSDGTCAAFDAGPSFDAGFMCEVGLGDCNFDHADGCETPLDTVEDCGACENTCRLDHATPECRAGACAIAACADGWADCDGMAENGCERSVRTTTDCGTCGTVCDLPHAGETCATGSCALGACHPGWGDCDSMPSTGCETSLITGSNCGSCGAPCDALAPNCNAGTCVAVCPGTACGTSCVNLASEPQHCGACNNVCSAERGAPACSASACTLGACDAQWGNCNASASDGCETPLVTTSDCGACGTACSSPTGLLSCASGTCQIDDCNPGLDDCDGTVGNGCEADLRSTTSCGSCAMVCSGATPLCGVDGETTECLAACVEPAPDACGDRCFDTSSDPDHCGGCGLSCVLPDATARCDDGECLVAACTDPNLGDCDGVGSNGCETDLTTTVEHCGACGNACIAGPGEMARCLASECATMCPPGFDDCDGLPENGCEQEVNTLEHCGACNAACAPANATGTCNDGSCDVATCNVGFDDCDGTDTNGCEARLMTDRNNCGSCNFRCSGPMRNCCNGTCCN